MMSNVPPSSHLLDDPDKLIGIVHDRLQGRSRPALLALSTLLSWEDAVVRPMVEGHDEGAFLPLTNAPTLQLFSRCVLQSDLSDDSNRIPGASSLVAIMDLLSKVLSGSTNKQERIPYMDEDTLILEVLIPLIKHQFRLDGRRAPDGLARNYALFVDFPERFKGEIRKRMKANYFDLTEDFEKNVDLKPIDILLGIFCFLGFFQHRFLNEYESDSFRSTWVNNTQRNARQAKSFEKYLYKNHFCKRQVSGIQHSWELLWLTQEEALKVLKPLRPDRRAAWLSRLSATPGELNAKFSERPYAVGPVEHRALPLEEKPLVRLPLSGRGECFTVPNARSFIKGAPNLIDRLARAHFPTARLEPFDTLRGLLQEIYLREMTHRQLSDTYQVIPERRYSRPNMSGKPADGPDLTIVDSSAQALILVESKARPFTDIARAADGLDGLHRMDELLTDAAVKARWKAADLLNPDVGPYQAYRASLDSTRPDRQIVVLVYFETLPGFQRAWQVMRKRPDHPLHGDTRLILPLSVDEFEWIVEAAAQSKRSLYAMLRAQARTTLRQDLQIGRWTTPDIKFHNRYLDHWWEQMRTLSHTSSTDVSE